MTDGPGYVATLPLSVWRDIRTALDKAPKSGSTTQILSTLKEMISYTLSFNRQMSPFPDETFEQDMTATLILPYPYLKLLSDALATTGWRPTDALTHIFETTYRQS